MGTHLPDPDVSYVKGHLPQITGQFGEVLAGDQGEMTVNRYLGSSTPALESGILRLTGWTAASSAEATYIQFVIGDTGAAGLTLADVGIFSVDDSGGGALIASTGDFHDSSGLATPYTIVSVNLTEIFDRVAGQRYAIGALLIGDTMPTVYGGYLNWGFAGLLPWVCGHIDSLTEMPTSFTFGDIDGGGDHMFGFRVAP